MTPVIFDCDPGHDDVVALLLALASSEVELLGVTTVAGNQTLERVTRNALAVLEHVARADVPVLAGAPRPLVRELTVAADVHGESGLDGARLKPPTGGPLPARACDWIAQTIEQSTRPLTIVATGPLTNIALLLALYPEVESAIDRIVLMGGSIGEGNVTPAAEFNIWSDPEAATRVLQSDIDITMIGLDVTHRALLTPKELRELHGAGRAGRLVADMYGFYLKFHAERYGWRGAPAHDAMAMAYVIDTDLFTTQTVGVTVDIGTGLGRGRTYVDRWRVTDWPASTRVATEVDGPRFLRLLVERIARLG